MLEMLENLRRKPESYRRKVAIIVPTVAVGLMAVIWMMTFSIEFPDFSNSPQNQAAAIMANSDDGTSPIQSLQQGLSAGASNLTQNWDDASSTSDGTQSNVVILTPDGNSQ